MTISFLTLFPDMFAGPFHESIIQRAVKKGAVTIRIINIRDFANDAHKSVDDRPYGGGTGMIMRVDVIDKALQYVKQSVQSHTIRTVLLDPAGKKFSHHLARTYATVDHLILIAGHYEGVDARVLTLVDEVVSIGDYILTGGELPAMVIADCVIRLIPGVLSKKDATTNESFEQEGLLEYPQYTRPEEYAHLRVPDILLSGNHRDIALWRKEQAKKKTSQHRPDLLKK